MSPTRVAILAALRERVHMLPWERDPTLQEPARCAEKSRRAYQRKIPRRASGTEETQPAPVGASSGLMSTTLARRGTDLEGV